MRASKPWIGPSFTVIALLLSACAPSPMVKIERDPAPTKATVVTSAPPAMPSSSRPSPGKTSIPVPSVKPGVGIQPDLVCAVPQEDYDIMSVVKTRLGVEAAARLDRLLATDFKNSDLAPKDRELLKFIARETLWIPPMVERWIGDAYFNAGKAALVPIDATALANQQTFATKTLTDIVNVSPQTPFDIELMVVQSGTPSSLAGGRIFMDLATVRNAMNGRKGTERKDKLVFIYAHELAHIYKRHKAKRLQEYLISIDEAHKLVRILLTAPTAASSIQSLTETIGSLNAIVKGLRSHQADFLHSQEVEADACAASLMVQSKLGDPVKGFATYAKERGASEQGWTVYDDHPPDEQRKLIIEYVVKSGQLKKPIPLEDVKTNLARHVKAAAKHDQ